jgi:hypothetical protein
MGITRKSGPRKKKPVKKTVSLQNMRTYKQEIQADDEICE